MASKNELDSNYPIEVAAGGTGGASHTAYTVLTGGTTATNPVQSVASVGTSGQILESQGPNALPQFSTITLVSNNGLVLIQTQQGAGSDLEFTTGITSSYHNLMFFFSNVLFSSAGGLQYSLDGGSSYVATNYYFDCHWRAFDSTTYHTNSSGPTSALAFGSGLDTDFAATGCLWIYRGSPGASPFDPAITGMVVGKQSSTLTLTQFMGYHDGNIDAIDAIKFKGINTGTVSLYGLVFA